MRKSIPVVASLAISLLVSSQVVFAQDAPLPANDILSKAEGQTIAQQADIKSINLLDKSNLKEGQQAASTQAATLFTPVIQGGRIINFSPRDFAESVIQTSDGGYATVGSTTVNGNEDILFIKTDASYNYQLAYAFGGTASETGIGVRATADGGYIIAGTSNGSGSSDILLIKISATGVIQWSSTFGGPGNEVAAALDIGSDGGYIVAGTKESSSYSNDAYIIKVSATGGVQWTRTFGVDGLEDRYNGVSATPDGGYVAVGYKTVTENLNPGTAQTLYGLMVKYNSSGNIVFQTTLDRYAILNAVAATSSGYVAAGGINNYDLPNNNQGYNIFVTKVSTSGSKNWSSQFNATNGDFANDVKPALDGNFVVTGFVTTAVYKEDLLLMKIDNSGNALWSNTYQVSANAGEIGNSVATTNDGGYIVGGSYLTQDSGGNDNYDALLLKFSSD